MGLSLGKLSLSHATPPHALIASRKDKPAAPNAHAAELPGGAADAAGGAPGGPGVEGGVADGAEGEGAAASEDLDLMYDPMLNCYYDPKTNKYYELA